MNHFRLMAVLALRIVAIALDKSLAKVLVDFGLRDVLRDLRTFRRVFLRAIDYLLVSGLVISLGDEMSRLGRMSDDDGYQRSNAANDEQEHSQWRTTFLCHDSFQSAESCLPSLSSMNMPIANPTSTI